MTKHFAPCPPISILDPLLLTNLVRHLSIPSLGVLLHPQGVIDQPNETPTYPTPRPIPYMVKNAKHDIVTLAVKGPNGLSLR